MIPEPSSSRIWRKSVIAETTANLTPHLGHKVEITGVAVPGKDKTHTMKVTAVKTISSKVSLGLGLAKGG